MFTTRPELSGTFGMVASTHWLASQSGMAVLESGGNAFDAAVPTAFVLDVVEPHLNGPGGDLPAIFTTADDPTQTVLCAQGPDPAAGTVGHYAGLGLELVPGTGFLAATVPGAVVGWLTLLRDHGTRSLAEVLSYAIGYAEAGHPLLPRVAATIGMVEALFRSHWPTRRRCGWPTAYRKRGHSSAIRRWRRRTGGSTRARPGLPMRSPRPAARRRRASQPSLRPSSPAICTRMTPSA